MSIGSNIKKYRKKLRYSQTALAKKADLSLMSVRRYEDDQREPSPKALLRISRALGVSVTDLLEPEPISLSEIDALFDNDTPPTDTTQGNDTLKAQLDVNFQKLNPTGQQKAADYVEDLTKIEEYTEKE